jgi:hypothetical protein
VSFALKLKFNFALIKFSAIKSFFAIGIIVVMLLACSKEESRVTSPEWYNTCLIVGDSMFVSCNLLSEVIPDSININFFINGRLKQHGNNSVFIYRLAHGDSVLVRHIDLFTGRRCYTNVDTVKFKYDEVEVIPVIISD